MAVIEVSCTVSVFVDHYAFVLLGRGSPDPTMRQSGPTNALVKRAQPLSLSLSEAEDQSRRTEALLLDEQLLPDGMKGGVIYESGRVSLGQR